MGTDSSNGSFILHSFLFHLRTPLSGIKGAWQLAKQWNEKVPASVLDWLKKWMPEVERWISAEEKARLFLRDGEEHDWEQIVYEMAKDMKNVSVAYAEGESLQFPQSPEGEGIFNLTLRGGFKYLNGIIQPILNKDFHHLLQ